MEVVAQKRNEMCMPKETFLNLIDTIIKIQFQLSLCRHTNHLTDLLTL